MDMTELGVFLSGEEQGPNHLLEQAQLAERAGFNAVLISDHFHPWTERQGQSPFVWGVIGAIAATTSHKVTTGVTCPILRIHPAIIAQAAATAQIQLRGRFVLGLGTGEALNEHILGQRWPSIDTRLEMLEEAIGVIRALWQGDLVRHNGAHYTVDDAKLYSLPDSPPPVVISAFGPKALAVAARVGDGLVTVAPDDEVVQSYRDQQGAGPTLGALKVCWDEDESRARKLAHELWPTERLPGQQSQELPMPAHFEEAASIVTEDMVAEKVACGPDPERHVKAISEFLEAGFDEVYINQIGASWTGFLEFFNKEVRPRLSL
jgi:G6PDH family F420-dependent oxidoreductase